MEQSGAGSRKQLSLLMFIGGALGLVFGGIHLASYLSSGASISLSDAGFNAGAGVLWIFAGWFITKGKRLAVFLWSLTYSQA
jgi:hypothetical protein